MKRIHAILKVNGRTYPKRVVNNYGHLPSTHDPITGKIDGKVETLRVSAYKEYGYLYFRLDGRIKYISTPCLCDKSMDIEITTEAL